ncbi:unnamed protein product, partial [Rotaria sp. Silwood1]
MQAVPVLSSAFNYTSSSVSTIGYLTSFVASTFSSYNSLPSSLILNSALKVTTLTEVPNFMDAPIPIPGIGWNWNWSEL